MASNDVVTKKADISETPQVDLEAESSSPDEKDWVYKSDRAESAELTQVEAFSWNVEGDQSPFPEVAACVSNKDDSTIKCNTVRAWILMTIFVIIFSGVNQFFGLRYPSLAIGYVVAQILVFPIGRAWEKLPIWTVPLWRFSILGNSL